MAKKIVTGLGKGLGALLGEGEYSVLAPTSSARLKADTNTNIKIDSIDLNPGQPRTDFDPVALEELAQSIKTYGLIQPITVRPIEKGRYQLISGERRLRAAKLAGMTEIPAYVRSVDEIQSIQMALVENIQREDLNAIEIAVSYQRLLDECNLSQDELSEKVGKGKTTIVNYLRLLKLSKEVQIAVRDNTISMSHARVIVGFEDFEIQNKLLEEILKKNLSVHEAESLAKKIAKEVKPRRKINVRLSDKVISFKDELSTRLGSKISIVKDAKGIGKITIPFKSDDDLARIIEMLSK